MGRRKSIKNEFRDYLVNAGLSMAFWSFTAWGLNRYGNMNVDWAFPVIVGGVTPILHRVLSSSRMTTPAISYGYTAQSAIQSTRRGVFASTSRWSIGGYDSRLQDNARDYTTRTIRYDTPAPSTLFWDIPLPNRLQPIRITEDELHRFIVKASQRQRSGLSTFSRNYFKRQFSEPKYRAMVHVLSYCGLIYNRGQGASGELSVLTPYAAIWQVKSVFPLSD